MTIVERLRSGESRGQALVELAIVTPVMLMLMLAALDLGRVFYAEITIQNAAREGALEASTNYTSWQANANCNKTTNAVMCRVLGEATSGWVTVAKGDVSMSCAPSC